VLVEESDHALDARAPDWRHHSVAEGIAPVEPELAIAFEDCDRPPMPAPSAAVTAEHSLAGRCADYSLVAIGTA
jgi:hypothetical protein